MNRPPSDRLREAYERRAELEYPRPAPPPDPSIDRKFQRIWKLVGAQLPCESFLDAGCGDGRYLAAFGALAERPARIVGVDISERILETARDAAEAAGIRPELVRANLEALPFDDETFDLVLCTQVIEHLLDPGAGLRELARVARPGAKLVVSTDNRRSASRLLNAPRTALVRLLRLSGRRRLVEFPHTAFEVEELVRLAEGAGLEVERVETFRFHLDGALGRRVQRLLNRLDAALPPHRRGDIIAAVCRKGAT